CRGVAAAASNHAAAPGLSRCATPSKTKDRVAAATRSSSKACAHPHQRAVLILAVRAPNLKRHAVASMRAPHEGLSAETLFRLAKICGLFGSHHAGERAAAAEKAHQLVRSA